MQPYKKLFTYWYSVIIYDLTVKFCKKFLLSNLGNLSHLRAPDRRMADQMIQAARSGKQNIVEGSDVLRTSLKMGIKLTGTAKSSLEELTADLEDFLRQRGLSQWPKNDQRTLTFRRRAVKFVRHLRNLSNLSNLSNLRAQPRETGLGRKLVLPENPERATNLLLTLCHQASYLLSKQISSLEKKHAIEGGYTEKLYKRRIAGRQRRPRR